MLSPGLVPVRTGDLVAGKYRVERVVGYGGMGIVVAARHEQLGQLVAIKFVRDETLNHSEAVERFVREARAAVKLRSEHVARVLDVGVLESGAPYMVMEFLDGNDLSKVLEQGGPLPVETAVYILLQACEAVAEAHAAGIVHRDLKPQNLFLTTTVGGSAKLKVLDFGVSKAIGLTNDPRALTRTSSMLGSPLYMAPEQMRSARDVDPRVDVWALGVVLFELLTLRWPFEADNMPELCLRVVNDPPQSLLAFRPDVAPGLARIVERCLEKNPKDRFANAGELATAIAPYTPLSGRLVPHGSIPPAQGIAPSAAGSSGATPWSAAHASSSLPSHPSGEPIVTPAAWGSPRSSAPENRFGSRTAQSEPASPHPTPAWVWAFAVAMALLLLGGGAAIRKVASGRSGMREQAWASASAPGSVHPPEARPASTLWQEPAVGASAPPAPGMHIPPLDEATPHAASSDAKLSATNLQAGSSNMSSSPPKARTVSNVSQKPMTKPVLDEDIPQFR